MICKKVNELNTVGSTEIPLKPLIDNVLNFIDTYLPLLPQVLIETNSNTENEVEKLLNQYLIDFFNGHSPNFNQYLQSLAS